MTSNKEICVLAGGCFWGMEDILRKLDGVLETDVGYTGGHTPNPRYENVKNGDTGHAEALRLEFDPNVISFERILDLFFRMHNPTTVNQQGNDRGSQYRSAIFYLSEEQKQTAEKKIAEAQESGRWQHSIVTEIVPFKEFFKAEEFHQDYLENFPQGYTCHYIRE